MVPLEPGLDAWLELANALEANLMVGRRQSGQTRSRTPTAPHRSQLRSPTRSCGSPVKPLLPTTESMPDQKILEGWFVDLETQISEPVGVLITNVPHMSLTIPIARAWSSTPTHH